MTALSEKSLQLKILNPCKVTEKHVSEVEFLKVTGNLFPIHKNSIGCLVIL